MIFAILALLSASLRGPGSDHCGPESTVADATDRSGGAHHQEPAPRQSEDSETADDCPHCPTSQCATQPSCSIQVAITLTHGDELRGGPDLFEVQPNPLAVSTSLASIPPTPPPQPLG